MQRKHLRHFINSNWTSGTEVDWVQIELPGGGEPKSQLPIGGLIEINEAVAAAKAALPAWQSLSVVERCSYLDKVADLLDEQFVSPSERTDLKKLITREVGKVFAEADIEVMESVDMFRYMVQVAESEITDEILELDETIWPSKKSKHQWEPLGVVALIKAWNYPLELIVWSIGPALVAGNTVILKPSEHSSETASFLVGLFELAGFPPGVVNMVLGDGTTGAVLARHPRVNVVSFTGSVPVGLEIASHCASRLCKYNLELSGNDAAIVLADADVELATNGLVWGAFCNAGQVCVRPKRVFVHRSIAQEFIKSAVEKTAQLRLGVDIGPLISGKQMDSVKDFVADAITNGAELLHGGSQNLSLDGNFYIPTILSDVPETSRIMTEECFGPVMPINVFDTIDEAVIKSNSSNYGLGASVWSSNLSLAESVARKLEVGMVWINDINVAFPQAAWGGTKQSGVGFELSQHAIRQYCRPKHISLELTTEAKRDWWFPYSESQGG